MENLKIQKNITFRLIENNDFEELLQTFNYYILNSTKSWYIKELSIDQLKEHLPFSHSKYATYIIELDGNNIGYVAFKQFNRKIGYDRTAEISIQIKPECTHQGIGTKALKYIEEKAQLKGIKTLVSTISGENEASLALFKKCSYFQCGLLKEVGEKFGRVLDLVIYQKIL